MLQLPRMPLIVLATLLLAGCAPVLPPAAGGATISGGPTTGIATTAAATSAPAPALAATSHAANTPVAGTGGIRLANPASIYCAAKGGLVSIVTDAQGAQSGMCVFPDGSQCDEWAYYRGECQPASPPAPSAPEAGLQNGQYELPYIGAFQLQNGKYEQKTGAGATQVKQVGLNHATAGDLNGDGAQDAVAELWANTGGSGVFEYLVALLNKKGDWQQVTAGLLGDRVQVTSLAVQPQGRIVVNLRVHKTSDPLCCPSQAVTRTYRLQGNTLELVSEVVASPGP
jgi:putative hemolysin